MTDVPGNGVGGRADRGRVTAALLMLEQLNLTPADLVEGVATRAVPTFAELVPVVVEVMPVGSRPGFRSYLSKLVRFCGSRRLDEFEVDEVARFLAHVRETAEVRRSGTGGNEAARHAHRALSWLYRYAVDRGLVGARENVMLQVPRPRAGQARRHGLSPELVAEILAVARTTGHDPALDALILRFHLETAARTGGALALRLGDLDRDQSLVRLREKGSSERWQPVSPTLMEHLLVHARERGARDAGDSAFRSRRGGPLRRPHYLQLWERVGGRVETVRTRGISTHWLRHTTLTWVERNFGYAVARAFAGHAAPSTPMYGITQVYVKAGVVEVATALQALTGERHPLALEPSPRSSRSSPRDVEVAAIDPSPVGHDGLRWSVADGGLGTATEEKSQVDEVLVGRIRQLLDEAALAGRRRPSRDALVKATGASRFRVSVALTWMGGGCDVGLLQRVRESLEEAMRAGRRSPGAASLAQEFGVARYQVELALAEVRGTAARPPWSDRDELVEQVRRLREEAGRVGRGRRPGVVSLARRLGVPRRRVELALAEIRGMTGDEVPDVDSGAGRERDELVDRVSRVLEEAGRTGRPCPGVADLVRQLGVSTWRVELALAEVRGRVKGSARGRGVGGNDDGVTEPC